MSALTSFFGGAAAQIGRAFALMEACEEEIAAAKKRHRRRAAAIDKVFGVSAPTTPVVGKGEELYRAHVREMIERAVAGTPAVDATDAELIGALCDMSQIAPLNSVAGQLYERLFLKRLPQAARKCGASTRDVFGVDDFEREMRRKLKMPKRTVTW